MTGSSAVGQEVEKGVGGAGAELVKVSLSLHRSDPGAQWGASSWFQTTRKAFSTFLTPFHFPFDVSIPLCC